MSKVSSEVLKTVQNVLERYEAEVVDTPMTPSSMPETSVVAASALLVQSVGLADGGVEVNSSSPGPAPVAQARASNSRLTRSNWAHMSPAEAAQEGPQRGWRLDHASDDAICPTSTQRVGIVDAVPTCQRRRSPVPAHRPGQRCSPPVHPDPRRRARVTGSISPVLATRQGSSKATEMRSGRSGVNIYWVLLVSGWFFVQSPLSQIQRSAFSPLLQTSDILSFGGSGLRGSLTIQSTYPRLSKTIIDEIDSVLAEFYASQWRNWTSLSTTTSSIASGGSGRADG